MALHNEEVIIIGSGAGGLATACLLAKTGYNVTLLEKNDRLGGRASVFQAEGYTFDMGPSWYMMPGVFEHFFSLLGERIEDHFTLSRLDPSYRIFFESEAEPLDIRSDRAYLRELFDDIEAGAGARLLEHLDAGAYQFETALQHFMYKNYDSLLDFMNWRLLREGRKLPLFKSMESIVNSRFTDERLRKILQYQTVLLGTSPRECPGIYSLMNHIDLDQGIWYPEGGLTAVAEAMVRIAREHGVTIRTGMPVKRILVEGGRTTGVETEAGERLEANIVVSNADLTHTDTQLLDGGMGDRSLAYWQERKMTPSGFILYLGVDDRVDTLTHHNLFFIDDWERGNQEVFSGRTLPRDPSYYVCCPSKTDQNVAPAGRENLFVLVPTAVGLEPTEEDFDRFERSILAHMEDRLGIPKLSERIDFRRRYTTYDFSHDYNAYQGNALSGMAHTLRQTAWFRPNNKHKHIEGLYYVGAGTNPGIGVPTCLISAEMVYKRIQGISTPAPLTSL